MNLHHIPDVPRLPASGAPSGSGVRSTLTLGAPGATSVVATISVSGGDLIDWTLEKSTDGVSWTTAASGITGTTQAATGLTPNTQYMFRHADARIKLADGSIVSCVTGEQVYLPVLENRTFIMPGSGMMGYKTIPGGESRLLKLHIASFNPAFTEAEVLLLNPWPTTYQVKLARIGNMDATQNAGFVDVVTTPTTVPAGDGLIPNEDYVDSERPGVLSLGSIPVTMGATNGFQLALTLSDDAPGCMWVDGAIGYDISLDKIPRDLSVSWDLSGAETSWGIHPCIAVIFRGVETDLVTLPMNGDSWTRGQGDRDNPLLGGLGVPSRLNARWGAAGVKICPINIGRDGASTSVLAARAQWIKDVFAPRCMASQFYSINNDVQGEGNANVVTDFESVESLMSPQPVLPFLMAGNNAGSSGWWAPVRAMEEAFVASRSETIDISAPIINPADGTILPGKNIGPSHPRGSAYDDMEAGCYAAIRAWCEAKAGQSL